MSTVIFKTENAVFKFALEEVKESLIIPESEYNHDEVTQSVELILTDASETILNSDKAHLCVAGGNSLPSPLQHTDDPRWDKGGGL